MLLQKIKSARWRKRKRRDQVGGGGRMRARGEERKIEEKKGRKIKNDISTFRNDR